MIIKKLRADFGTLHGNELELHDGLNVIEQPNESGKSTWCAFIRAMLYGVDSSERARAGHQPDKVKFAPWEGFPMRGEMELCHGGREITLTRSTKSANAPMREFSAVYTGTGEPVTGLTGANAGETLTGAAKGVYERSAFIKQAGVAISGSPELETRIAALVSSGAEDECWDDADARLRAWQRARRWNKRGRIPELENQIAEKDEALRGLKTAGRERAELRRDLELAEAELPRIQAEIAEERRTLRRAALERLSENKRLLHESESAAQEAEKTLAERKKELTALPFDENTEPKDILQDADAAAKRADEQREAARKVPSAALFIIPALLLIASLLCAFVAWYITAAGAVLSLALAIAIFFVRKKALSKVREAEKGLNRILSQYRADSPEEIAKQAELLSNARALAAAAETAAAEARAEYERISASQQVLDKSILSDLDISSSGRRLTEAQARVSVLREQLAKAEGGLGVMGDPLVLESEKRELEEKLELLTVQYEALDLAVSALAEANTEMQTRFSPTLGRRAGELFARMTGGKYETLSIDRGFAASVRETGDAASRDSLFLSAGTQDQLYLALRLAICELVLDGEETCPIILDDALCSFDDERMALALELLLELGGERQIILFTCQGRETAYLSSRGNA